MERVEFVAGGIVGEAAENPFEFGVVAVDIVATNGEDVAFDGGSADFLFKDALVDVLEIAVLGSFSGFADFGVEGVVVIAIGEGDDVVAVVFLVFADS